MDNFLANAEEILEAADSCARGSGGPPGDWTILVGWRGEIEMVAGSEWTLETLRGQRGAAMAFRVEERQGRVAVEGRMSARSCRLETETPRSVAHRLLDRVPAYTLAAPALPEGPAGAAILRRW